VFTPPVITTTNVLYVVSGLSLEKRITYSGLQLDKVMTLSGLVLLDKVVTVTGLKLGV
jgi:hypothetical protein